MNHEHKRELRSITIDDALRVEEQDDGSINTTPLPNADSILLIRAYNTYITVMYGQQHD